MMDKHFFGMIVAGWIILACIIFIVMLFITAPYGRHTTTKWGITISNKTGWILMEIPALLMFLYFVFSGSSEKNMVVWIIVILFSVHYTNRSLIYPFRIKTSGKKMPMVIVVMAVVFNVMNGCVNGYFLGTLQEQYTFEWLTDARFIAGIVIFISGALINIISDEKLISLRKDRSNGYQIPYGGLFNLVSCPNFFGEIIEWLGFALMCWSLPAVSFFVWTVCNLVPRALDHHRWYKKNFPAYPADRKAVFPFLL